MHLVGVFLKVFNYIAELDCFEVSNEFKTITHELNLAEWNEVVWIGRYFLMDNDFGEHWFDNWALREQFESRAVELGYTTDNLFFIDPERFENGKDGPCHSNEERKRFWTDVCRSLHVSFDTIFAEARKINQQLKDVDEPYLEEIELQIAEISKRYT